MVTPRLDLVTHCAMCGKSHPNQLLADRLVRYWCGDGWEPGGYDEPELLCKCTGRVKKES